MLVESDGLAGVEPSKSAASRRKQNSGGGLVDNDLHKLTSRRRVTTWKRTMPSWMFKQGRPHGFVAGNRVSRPG
jgi:hypothetical protein